MVVPNAYERRKAPEKVRTALVDATARLIAEHGLSRLTIDAVARSAGVTKGGLFHHFASKDELIRGVIGAMVDAASTSIDARMAVDPEPHGSFTRAYLASVFAEDEVTEQTSLRTLCMAMLADPSLQQMWFDWVKEQVARHAATDDNPGCALVRLTADGAWLNSLRHGTRPPPLPEGVHTILIDLTRP